MNRLDELFASFPEHLSIGHVQQVTGASRSAIYRWLADGTLPAMKVGGTWVMHRDEVREALEAGRTRPRQSDTSDAKPQEPGA